MTTPPFYPELLELRPERFNELALELFRYQAAHNPVYREFLAGIGCRSDALTRWEAIPALPIAFFRSHRVLVQVEGPSSRSAFAHLSGHAESGSTADPGSALKSGSTADPGSAAYPSPRVPLVFESSGSTSQTASRHFVPDPGRYRDAFLRGFRLAYGQPADWAFLFLLPAYLEREGSSLIWMCRELAALSRQPETGFFLYDHQALWTAVASSLARNQPTMLLGVSFALWDLASEGHPLLPGREHLVVVETGGMKGRRRELLREELHAILGRGLGLERIHSEYGMTELLSQAWSAGEGRFRCPPWMRVRIRDPYDPLSPATPGSTGVLDVIDLANADSCAFVATDDLGRMHEDGSFEVLGRLDASEMRGCNLMMA